jgi:hypothetical protein
MYVKDRPLAACSVQYLVASLCLVDPATSSLIASLPVPIPVTGLGLNRQSCSNREGNFVRMD